MKKYTLIVLAIILTFSCTKKNDNTSVQNITDNQGSQQNYSASKSSDSIDKDSTAKIETMIVKTDYGKYKVSKKFVKHFNDKTEKKNTYKNNRIFYSLSTYKEKGDADGRCVSVKFELDEPKGLSQSTNKAIIKWIDYIYNDLYPISEGKEYSIFKYNGNNYKSMVEHYAKQYLKIFKDRFLEINSDLFSQNEYNNFSTPSLENSIYCIHKSQNIVCYQYTYYCNTGGASSFNNAEFAVFNSKNGKQYKFKDIISNESLFFKVAGVNEEVSVAPTKDGLLFIQYSDSVKKISWKEAKNFVTKDIRKEFQKHLFN